MHTEQLTEWTRLCTGIHPKEATLPPYTGMTGELGSGMFSRLCFGVRLRGDRAAINLTAHLGSLKPETARQFINLNLLVLQLDKGELWEALTGPRCSSLADSTHTSISVQLPPPTSSACSCLSSWPWAWCVSACTVRRHWSTLIQYPPGNPLCKGKLASSKPLALGDQGKFFID